MKKELLDIIKRSYPKGTRVKLIHLDDVQAPPSGTKGTVIGVDDIGTILVSWDNGSSLNVVYGITVDMEKVKEALLNYKQGLFYYP